MRHERERINLIPREDAVERMCGINCGCTRDMCMYGDSGCAMVQFVEEITSVPAVPLDKLCEWLQENASLTYGTLISAAGWKYELTRWMEGLDAEIH